MANNIFDSIRGQSPYRDDFDPTKKFTQILAVPGRVEQAREFTQAQSMSMEFMKRISDTLMKEGNITEGMSFVKERNKLTVTKGKVYLQGLIHEFDEQSVTLSETGEELVGVKLNVEVVTELDDGSLRDPATDSMNYGMEGAHRIKATPVLTLNDTTANTIYKFVDGGLYIDQATPQYDTLSETLARRTYDESGNYRIRGLELSVEAYSEEEVNLVVESGKAYIMGYEVIKPTGMKIRVPKSLDKRTVIAEPKVFDSSSTKYTLNNYPVASVSRLTAVIQETVNVTRGAVFGGVDLLPNTPVVAVTDVSASNVTYINGTDYQVTGEGIDWSPSGKEPSIGSSYSVTYQYNKVLEQGRDYTVQTQTINGVSRNYISFGDTFNPVAGSQFLVDYDFFLARKDLVSLNPQGDIIITPGQSDTINAVSTPVNTDPDILHLGTLYLPPNESNCTALSYSVTRLSMEDLSRMLKRLEDIEYNQAMTELDREAMLGEDPTNLKGILSDNFSTITKGDLTHPDFSVAYDLEYGFICLMTEKTEGDNPSINLSETTAKQWRRLITAPCVEEIVVEQPFASTSMLVNPYHVFNALSILKLSPEVDNFIDETKIVIENESTASYTINRWWAHGGETYYDTEKYLYENMVLESHDKWESIGYMESFSGTITSSSSRTLLDEMSAFMRQIEVTVEASNLIPGSDNLTLYFDGVVAPLTPVSPYSSGTSVGTLKADSNGNTKGKFTVPSGIRCGTREVVLKNSNNTSSTSFTSTGRKRIVEETINRIRVTGLAVDPLAQTFQFDSTRVLTSVGLYFASGDSAGKNVIVQIRNVVNGYPGNLVYAEKLLNSSNIKVSDKGTSETKVSFDDPITCSANTQYCVVVETDSAEYSLHVGELGGKDAVSGNTIAKNPYLEGVLFSSANAITWTAHQTMDLKFRVYCAKFESKGVITFNQLKNVEIDRLVVFADYLTPSNTGCKWEMKLGDEEFQPIGTYEDKDLPQVARSVILRATFTSEPLISPMLASDSFLIMGFKTSTSGSYITRNVAMSEGYNEVKIIFDAFIPSGCTVTPRFSGDNSTWIPLTTLVSSETVTNQYVRYTYKYTVPSGTNYKNYRARIDINSSSRITKPKVRRLMNIVK